MIWLKKWDEEEDTAFLLEIEEEEVELTAAEIAALANGWRMVAAAIGMEG